MTAPCPPAAAHPHAPPRYAYVDALRGYAVLMVFTCHTGAVFAELPYPLKKLTNFGWHGVQLFFLVSCVTLMLSWRADEDRGRSDVVAFWVRRLFRVAPLYYLAAAFYFVTEPPPGKFDPTQLLASLTFVNAWHPTLIPTTPDGWTVVPGGWSIGVEFTFYLAFPLAALWVRSMRRSLAFVGAALAVGSIANMEAHGRLAATYGEVATNNFLYFWFPNQLVVFALGTVLFHLLQGLRAHPQARAAATLRKRGDAAALACVAGCVVAANIPFPGRLPMAAPLVLPAYLVASLVFVGFAAALSSGRAGVFVNRPIRSLGQASFSAYLLHFAVLHRLVALMPGVFRKDATGWSAVACFAALWTAAAPLTYALSRLTFGGIEQPMIAVGSRLIGALRRRPGGQESLAASRPAPLHGQH